MSFPVELRSLKKGTKLFELGFRESKSGNMRSLYTKLD